MHPDILRELISQRGREMREQAHRAGLARMIRSSRRVRDLRPDDEIVVPAIPDYVDGSFRTEPAADQVATEAGQEPVARHAA
jgi:ribose 1,5-bisphosphokinase PhnN